MTTMTPPSAELSITSPKMVCKNTEKSWEATNRTVLVTWNGILSNLRVKSSRMTGITGKLANPEAALPAKNPGIKPKSSEQRPR